MKLYNKDKKVEKFMKQKYKINEQKKIFSDQINKQKEMYSVKFENLFNKKNIDKQTLDSIKKMFPNNNHILDAINKYNEMVNK